MWGGGRSEEAGIHHRIFFSTLFYMFSVLIHFQVFFQLIDFPSILGEFLVFFVSVLC